MKSARLMCFLSLMLATTFPVFAQNNPNEDQGLKPFDSWHGGDLDSISMTNGGLVLHIPLVSFPQRGNLDLSFMVRFSSKQWYVKPAKYDAQGHLISSAVWQPMANSGTQIVSSVDWWMQSTHVLDSPGYDWSRGVTSPDGNTHQFGSDNSGGTSPTYPMRSLDASGLLHPDINTLILPNGTRYSDPNLTESTNTGPPPSNFKEGVQPSTITDANGNQITLNSNGWTDTMGRVSPGQIIATTFPVQAGVPTTDLSKCPAGTASAWIWNVPGVAAVNSGIRTFYFCYAMFTLQTNFQQPGVAESGPSSISMLSAVVLPDLTMWTFSYDSYGDVTRLGFPTGGSISYTYSIGPIDCNSGTMASQWVASRTVDANDGTGGHVWQYQFSGQVVNPFYSGQAKITSPDGNDTVHTIASPFSGAI